MPVEPGQLPLYVQVFEWAQPISTLIFPLAALAATVALFLIWRQIRRIAKYLAPRRRAHSIHTKEFAE